MASTTARVAARSRAREALAARQAERRKRDERMEAAMTQFFAAQDAIERARTEAGQAVAALIEEGETRSSIADMLGVAPREVKRALDDAPDSEGDGSEAADNAESSPEQTDERDQADGAAAHVS